jgi:predicted ester cyclase
MGRAREVLEAVWAKMEAGDLTGAAIHVADDVQVLDGPLEFDNREAFWANLTEFAEAFSEMRWTPTHWTEDGDAAVAEVVFSAVHTGPYVGKPASDKTISINEAVAVEVSAEGLITHWRSYPDAVSLLGQIGLLVEPRRHG